MQVDPELFASIVACVQPVMQRVDDRLQFVEGALYGSPLLSQVDVEGDVAAVTERLVRQLLSAGDLTPGDPAINVLLRACREQVSPARQQAIDALLQQSLASMIFLEIRPPHRDYEPVKVAAFDQAQDLLLNYQSVRLIGGVGMGKTELASLLARDRQIRRHFKDRIFWLSLGNHPNLMILLGSWLRAMGVGVDRLKSLTDAAARRDVLRERIERGSSTILTILDDVRRMEQLSGLIPPDLARIVLLLTTRDRALALPGERVTLSEIDRIEDRIRFIRQYVDIDDERADRLVRAVGGRPIDLLLTARQLHRKHAALVDEEIERIMSSPRDIWQQGYGGIALSVQELSEPAQRLLGMLADWFAEPDTISRAMCEQLIDDTEIVDEVVNSSLLKVDVDRQRYTLHAAIADYVRSALDTSEEDRRRAGQLLIDYTQQYRDDFDRLDMEYTGIDRVLIRAHETGETTWLVDGVLALYPYWEARGLTAAAVTHLGRAADASRDRDRLAYARIMLQLSRVHLNLGTPAQALSTVTDARDTLEAVLQSEDDLTDTHYMAMIHVYIHLGYIHYTQSEYETALVYWQNGLERARDRDATDELLTLLTNLGAVEQSVRGNPDAAEAYYQEAADVVRSAPDDLAPQARSQYSRLLRNRGLLQAYLTNFQTAEQYLQESRRIAADQRDVIRLSDALMGLGHLELDRGNSLKTIDDLEEAQGHFTVSRTHFEEALETTRKYGYPVFTAEVLAGLCEVALGTDNPDEAEDFLSQSLAYTLRADYAHYVDVLAMLLGEIARVRQTLRQFQYNTAVWDAVLDAAADHDVTLNRATALWWRARLETLMGNDTDAQAYLRQAEALAADDDAIRDTLARLTDDQA